MYDNINIDLKSSYSTADREITNSIKCKYCKSVNIDFFKNAFGKSVPIEPDGNRHRCPEKKTWRIDPRN